ncbi:hypothetical protein HG530_010806 [Fusarium avenaceum]|nr:hypothetical protein HG530_010806 [Fusarium avenaceum]
MIVADTYSHHVLILLYNGKLCKAPLKDDIQVLYPLLRELALVFGQCETFYRNLRSYRDANGVRDFADEFPNVKVIGTDLSPIQPSWLPPNLEFQIDDCTQEWTFQESSLDYVHMRFLVGSIVDWTALYKQAYKCLKPGGWIESHEAGPTIKSDDDSIPEDSAMGQWGKLFLEGGRRLQRPFSILEDDVQRQGMEEAGFTNIQEEEVKLPIGGWSSDPKTKEAGQYFQAAILQDVEGTLMFIANLLGWAKEEIHVFAARYRREIKSKNHHGYFLGKCYQSLLLASREFTFLDLVAERLIGSEILREIVSFLKKQVENHAPENNLTRRIEMCPIAGSPILEIIGADISSGRDSLGCPIFEILDNFSILECAAGQ